MILYTYKYVEYLNDGSAVFVLYNAFIILIKTWDCIILIRRTGYATGYKVGSLVELKTTCLWL